MIIKQPSYFNPRQVGGLVLWSDATDPAASGVLPANASALSGWIDKSVQGNNFSQGSGGNQPTFNTNQINGLPAITFNGSTSYMTAGSTNIPAGSTARTIFLVFRWTTLVNSYALAFGSNSPVGRISLGTYNGGSGTNYAFNAETNGAGTTGNTLLATNTTYIYEFNYAAGARLDAASVKVNNTAQTLTSSAVILNTVFGSTYVGCTVGPAAFAAVKVGEILEYNTALTSNSEILLYNYLKNKWGV